MWKKCDCACTMNKEVKVKSLGRARLLATPWTAAHQASLSTGFYRQEYWSGVPLPSPMSKESQIEMEEFQLHSHSTSGEGRRGFS